MIENLDKEIEVFRDDHILSWIYTHLSMTLDYSANEVINLLLLLEPDVSRWTFHPPTEAMITPSDLNEKERKIHVLFLLTMEYFEMRRDMIKFITNHLTLPTITDADYGFSHLVLKDLNLFLECKKKFPNMLEWSDRNQQSISSQLVQLRDAVAMSSMAEVKPYDCMVFTYGSNKNLSLGNALGTQRNKPTVIETKEIVEDDISFENVILGLNTTFLIASKQNSIFVSGRLGSEFHMTPKKFNFDKRVIAAAIGSSHAVVCSSQGVYGIGDNSQNQMGFGARVKSLKEFTYLPIERTFYEPTQDRIVAVETSNNHTIILSTNGFFAAGSNLGQMGQYAERRYSLKSGPPEHFIPLLPPDNSFAKPQKGTVGMSLLDDTTVLFSGSRLWVFHNNQEIKPVVDNSSLIMKVLACRPQFNECKLSVIIFTSDHKLYLWSECQPKRMAMIELASPVEMEIPRFNNIQVLNDMFMDRSNFACGANGDFLYVQNSLLYEGKILSVSKGHLNYTCRRVYSQPGFINAVFMSQDGGNKSLLVQKCRFHGEMFNDYGISRGYRKIKENFEKYALTLWLKSNSDPTTNIRIVASDRTFKVHSFMLSLRCPNLINLIHDGKINLKDYSGDAVGEYLQFVYTNKLITRQLFDNWVQTKSKKRFDSRISGYTQRLKRLRQLAVMLKYEELISAIFNTNDYIEYVESLKNSGHTEVYPHSERESDYVKPVLLKSIHLNYSDGDTKLCCNDGELSFYRSVLKIRLPYFDALFRWHGYNHKIRLDASTETTSFLCIFLLNSDLKNIGLNFDQMVDLLVVADRYMIDDLIVHISEIIDKHLTIDRLAVLISLLERLHLPSIEAAVSAYCSVNIAVLVENGLLSELPVHLLDMVQHNLNCWASRHYDHVYESSYNFMNECLNIDLEKDIFNDYVCKAKSLLSQADISLGQDPNAFLQEVNKARRLGRSRRKSSKISTASLEESFQTKNRESFTTTMEEKKKEPSKEEEVIKAVENLPVMFEKELKLVEEKPASSAIETRQPVQPPQETLVKPSSNGQKSLKEIMEEEAMLSAQKKKQTPQRVIQIPQSEVQPATFVQIETPTSSKSSNSWFKPATPTSAISLADVMNQQAKEAPLKPKPVPKKETTPIREVANPKKVTWNTQPTKAPATPSFTQIQKDEIRRAAETNNRQKLDFKLIEVEERAVNELQRFYENLVEDEDVTFRIVRIPPTLRT